MNSICTKLGYAGVVAWFCVSGLLGQGKTFRAGIELQGYPTGAIPGLCGDVYFNDVSRLHFRVGYNIVRHGDAGKHSDERGGGPGVSAGYDVQPFASRSISAGIRTDFWFNRIDWYDILPMDERESGTTRITVFQPTVQLGYRLSLSSRVDFIPNVSFGYEINIHTQGQEVGHGPILLLGFVVNCACRRK